MKKNFLSQKDIITYILFDRWPIRILLIVLAFLATLFGLAVPYFQKDFVQSLAYEPLLYSTVLALFSFVFLQLTNYLGQRESLIAQKVLSEKLYQRVLQLKSLSTRQKTVGEMVALYTTDVPSSTMWLEQTIPFALTTTFPLVLAPVFLNKIYAIPYTLTLTLLGLLICTNIFLARRQSHFFYHFKILAGQRMGLVNEWIQNIKGLKSLNWISGFENKIIKKRREETNNRIAMVTNGQIMNSISSSITFWLNLAIIFFISTLHQQRIGEVDLIAIMWVMGVFLAKPIRQLPWFFTMMFDAWTSVRRLGDFFQIQNENHIINDPQIHLAEDDTLIVQDLNLQIDQKKILNHISFKIKKHEIVALIGPIASGKSILMKSLMQETPFTAEGLKLVPYCHLPQEPFILSASISQNITFDYSLQNTQTLEKAQKALAHAQFDMALDRLPDGLNTLIGERGLNISGGQKQRLNLARLFYNPQPLFLLDDPFSAVDVGTEKKIIDSILELKKQGHSFLVITQRYEFLKSCDRIIYMDQGEIQFSGPYTEFIKQEKYQKFISGETND